MQGRGNSKDRGGKNGVLKKMLGCELHLAMNKNIECSRNVVTSLNPAIAIPTTNWQTIGYHLKNELKEAEKY